MYFLQSMPTSTTVAGFMIVAMVILAVQLLVIVLTCSVACGMVCCCRKRHMKGQSQKGKQSPAYIYIHVLFSLVVSIYTNFIYWQCTLIVGFLAHKTI